MGSPVDRLLMVFCVPVCVSWESPDDSNDSPGGFMWSPVCFLGSQGQSLPVFSWGSLLLLLESHEGVLWVCWRLHCVFRRSLGISCEFQVIFWVVLYVSRGLLAPPVVLPVVSLGSPVALWDPYGSLVCLLEILWFYCASPEAPPRVCW